MKQLIVFTLWIFALASCKNHSCRVLPEVEVEPILLSDSLVVGAPLQMRDIKSHLVFVTPGMEQSLLFFDKETQRTQLWGRMGNGPDDFTSAALVEYKDGKIKLFDSNLRKCVEYRLQVTDSVRLCRLQEFRYQSDSITLLSLIGIDNGMMVGFAGFGCKDMFVLLDDRMQLLKTFGTNPIEGFPTNNHLQMYGWFASYKNKFFFASQLTGYLVCYRIGNGGQVIKEWERFLTEPLFDSERKQWKKENRDGFFDIAANDRYLFTAFSGKSVADDKSVTPQNILVFTHDGEMVKNLKIRNATVGKIALSDKSRIYMIGSDKLMYCDLRQK